MGVGAAPRRLQTSRRPHVRHGFRRLRGGRRALSTRRPTTTGSSFCPKTISSAATSTTISGRWARPAPAAPARRSFRPARRGGDRLQTGPRDGQSGQPAGDRDLEPRVHAVQPQGQRLAGGASGAQRRYRHGLRAPLHDPPGQEIELRHRRVPAYDPAYFAAFGQDLRRRREVRRGDARHRRPPACHRLLDRRRAAAVERQGRLRHPPHPAPRRALRLYLPPASRNLRSASSLRGSWSRWGASSPN